MVSTLFKEALTDSVGGAISYARAQGNQVQGVCVIDGTKGSIFSIIRFSYQSFEYNNIARGRPLKYKNRYEQRNKFEEYQSFQNISVVL